MANISDLIENFLIQMLADGNIISISRNELATYFSCAPSQINYVLTTRFTPDRGYIIESHRGGGGYINLVRLEENRDELLDELRNIPINEGLSYSRAVQILDRLTVDGIITKKEALLIEATMSDKALIAPSVAKDGLRAGIMRSVATALLKQRETMRETPKNTQKED